MVGSDYLYMLFPDSCQHLWTVGRQDKLRVWEDSTQIGDNRLLPSGMQMQLNLIDQ